MIKVFITDDELLVLMGLRALTDWEAHEIEIVGEAKNGLAALEQIIETVPDIVITDLNMPVMDGIELIKRLKQTGFKGRIIALSNYNEFQMVKEAMKAGASDYLLKVTLNASELVQLIHSLAVTTDQEKNGLERKRKTGLALEWLQGDVEAADVRSRSETFRLKIGERNRLIAASVQRGDTGTPDDETLRNILSEVANRRFAVEVLNLGAARCLLVFPAGDPAFDEKDPEAVLRELSDDLRLLVHRYLNLGLYLVFEAATVPLHAMGSAVRRLADGLESEFYDHDQGVRSLDQIAITLELKEEFWRIKRQLRERLETGEDLSSLLAALFHHMEDKLYGNNAVRQIGRNLQMLVEEAVRDVDGELHAAIDPGFVERLDKAADFTAYKRSIEAMFSQVQAYLDQHRRTRMPDEIRKAVEFIKMNYRDKISLEGLSSHVNLNKNYFSTLFKLKTGLTPVEYIIQYKMDKARELLRTGRLSVGEVSQYLGYDDLSYFSRLFKKRCGVSPGSIANMNE